MATTSENLVEITDANFEEQVLGSSTPFLLDFSAEWCGPCKALAPTIAELASEYNGRIRFGTLDCDANPQTPTRFQVRGMPTLLLFSGGQVVGQLMGAQPKPKIVELLSKA
ncbi:MAG: thioredoxin [Deltaproteobacteria bacterium]|nr:thioredoxin [Deltaproteobacteria bacterium]